MRMDAEEIFVRFFEPEFMEDNKDSFEEVIKHIEGCNEEFIINMRIEDTETQAFNKSKDSNYKINNNINMINNGIEVPYNFKSFWDMIKTHIPKSIKRITIPTTCDGFNIEDLKEFPNLEEITISDYGSFTEEELDYLNDNTNVRRINVNRISSLQGKNNTTSSRRTLMYKDILVKEKDKEEKEAKDIYLYASSINAKQLKVILDHNSGYENVYLEVGEGKHVISFDGNDVSIKMKDYNFDNANKICDAFTSMGYNVKELTMSIEYRHNDKKEKIKYVDYDYTELDELSKKTNLLIELGSGFSTKATYEEFKGLIESMRWFRQIITDYDLSPLEKLAFAYDIMKTFNYNESEKDKSDSREPHRIIETGNIVCVGYTAMMREILQDLDPNLIISTFGCSCYHEDGELRGYHSRSMVRIDDDKYNIHGIYALDATWDSYHEDRKEEYGEDYDALSFYKYFMVPFTEYGTYFPNDTRPKFFDGKLKDFNESMTSEDIHSKIEMMAKSEIQEEGELPQQSDGTKLFDSYFAKDIVDQSKDPKEELSQFDSKRLPFGVFLELIRNVRIAQGYSGKELEEEMERIRRINSIFYGQGYVEEKGVELR